MSKMSFFNKTVTCYFLSVSLESSRSILTANIVTSVLNSFLALTATCGNALVVVIIFQQEALQIPSNALLCCLAISDLVVGLIIQPSFVVYKVTEIERYFGAYCTARMLHSCSGWLTASVSLLTLCAISVDRYLAVKLHLRYAAVVTMPRVIKAVVGFWIICAVSVALRFVMKNSHWNMAILATLFFIISVTVTSYVHVFKIVGRHRRQIHNSFKLAVRLHGRSVVEVVRHKKAAVTMLYILGTFCLCYLPFFGTIAAETVLGYKSAVKIAYDLTATIVFLSSSLNPALYCWRIRGIRQATVKILKRFRGIM